MKATALLKSQHDEVRAMFEQLEKGNGHRKEVLAKLLDSVAAHMVIEQELFYPAVLEAAEDLVLEGYEEHAMGRFAMKRLAKIEPSDRTFHAKIKSLSEFLEDHHSEEEKELFPKAEKALGERSEPLCAKMKALFDETVKLGFERTVAPKGPAVASAHAPE